MRQIKFRAYHHGLCKIFNVDLINFSNKGASLEGFSIPDKSTVTGTSTWCSYIEPKIDETKVDQGYLKQFISLMQFTGLLDKNGKEIYEGDIVQNYAVKADGSIKIDEIVNTHVVSIPSCYQSIWFGEMGESYEGIEIIGNIYENPDLLNSPSSSKAEGGE